MKITAGSFLEQANNLAGPYLIQFAQEVLPSVMSLIGYAHDLDDQPEADTPEEVMAWLATKARGGDLIFLQIIIFMEAQVPEEYKTGGHWK